MSRWKYAFTQGHAVEPLIARIRDLEHALATLQATYLTSPHPLLREDLREIGGALSTPSRPSPPPADDLDQLSENLGTLSMTGYGRSRFFGPTGSVAHMSNLEEETDETADDTDAADPSLTSLHLPPEILQLASAFPFPKPTSSAASIGDFIVARLPPSMEAWSLCETFFENGAYIFIPLSRAAFIEDIFAFFYRPNQKQNVDIPRGHRLAMLLMIFAIGDMLDLTKPAMPTGGKSFYYLARAAISLEPLFHQPTLTAVQAIILMNVYLSMSDHPEGPETVYVLAGLNLKLALMLGLHRDSLKFTTGQADTNTRSKGRLPRAAEEEMRRVIFHEVVHFETWMALMSGRPSLLNFDQYDCRAPGFYPERGNALETQHMKGQAWSHGFIRTCLLPVLHYAVAVKPPPYANVMELDAVIRAHNMPHHMEISYYEEAGPNSSENISRALIMLRFLSFKEIALLYLHRPYFACAMTDFSGDPLGCPFSKSVVASFACACAIITKVGLVFELEPVLSVRIWLFWNQLFVPCVCSWYVGLVGFYPPCSPKV
ncbi:hypothetical protein JB92DRAFT_2897510 [Gautieria morchelliformis]|nr:hypothetical protein JB92DRAFT_2897510 [Gautieria morchelliformis]